MHTHAGYLVELRNRKFNHMYVGITQEFEPYGTRVVVRTHVHRTTTHAWYMNHTTIPGWHPLTPIDTPNRRTGCG